MALPFQPSKQGLSTEIVHASLLGALGEQWVPSGEGKTQFWEASAPPTSTGLWMLSGDTTTIHIWPCCRILFPVQVLSHHVQPKQSF